MVTIQLIPEEFAGTGERDAFFDRMKATLREEAAEVKGRIEKTCRQDQCQDQLVAADAATNAKLAEIDQKRAAAKVRAQ